MTTTIEVKPIPRAPLWKRIIFLTQAISWWLFIRPIEKVAMSNEKTKDPKRGNNK